MRNRVLVVLLGMALLAGARLEGALAADGGDDLGAVVEPLVEPVAEPVEAAIEATRDPQSPAEGTGTQPTGQGFISYEVPASEIAAAHDAKEPSIGVDADGRALLLLNTTVARATFDDSVMPPAASWDDATPPTEPPTNLDPILYTDRSTYRTFNAQLEGEVAYGAITDDGGDTWTTTQPPTAAPSFDHQSVGAGPYPEGSVGPLTDYPNAVYYCSQLGLQVNLDNGYDSVSECARSDTGGLTWGPPVPINLFDCGGLHGKVVVDPSGSVYVPNRDCPDVPKAADAVRRQGVFFSRDAGQTWDHVVIPDTTPSNGDPAIAFDAAGRGYFVGNRDGHPVASVTTDGGATWTTPVDLGTAFGLQNNEFSMAVAGDAGRAAVAFLGTPTAGDDQAADFTGAWHLYESFTEDGGVTWTTTDITPNDPVQRGCIWMGGGSNPCRNLLDFDGMTADGQGRVLIGYADGCTGPCALASGTPSQSRDTLGVIARQVAGKRLVASFDPVTTPLYADLGGPYQTDAGAPVNLAATVFGGSGTYTISWDLDGDGAYDDATGATATFVSDVAGDHVVGVSVSDGTTTTKRGKGKKQTTTTGSTVTDSTTVTVRKDVQLAELQRWTFDGADGACDEQGWSTYDVVFDPTPAVPEVQTAKWHLVADQPASAPCAWSHDIDGADTYPSLQETTMMSPCLDLTGLSGRVEFDYAGELETDTDGSYFDTMDVGYQACGAQDVTVLKTFGGAAGDLDADPAQYITGAVDGFVGLGRVQIVFTIHSDEITELRGFQVDNVRVLAG